MKLPLGSKHHPIIKLKNHDSRNDIICVEEPLEIILEHYKHGQLIRTPLSITMRTPGDDEDLAIGFLYTEGVIDKIDDILQLHVTFDCDNYEDRNQQVVVRINPNKIIDIAKFQRHFYSNSSCGVCGKTSIDLSLESCPFILKSAKQSIDIKTIISIPESLRSNQNLYTATGANHGCGLFTLNGDMICVKEDVGRHNAMDKLVAYILKNNLSPIHDMIIAVSGRASFELIQKSLSVACPIFVAVGAPSSLAIKLAQDFGMTLIGFTRHDDANVYCGAERIIN